MIRAVIFDIGETLVDETRAFGEWADWLGVPRLTLFAALGSVIERGLWLGLAGNQPASALRELKALDLPVDFLLASEAAGVEKPGPEFFARLAAAAELPAREIACVGDRLDSDVLPAIAAGMRGVFPRRGPWGVVHARRAEVARADARIESLAELPAALAALDEAERA